MTGIEMMKHSMSLGKEVIKNSVSSEPKSGMEMMMESFGITKEKLSEIGAPIIQGIARVDAKLNQILVNQANAEVAAQGRHAELLSAIRQANSGIAPALDEPQEELSMEEIAEKIVEFEKQKSFENQQLNAKNDVLCIDTIKSVLQ